MYEKYSKGKLPGKSHKKKKVTTPVLAPSRRSKRHGDVDIVEGGIVAEPSMCEVNAESNAENIAESTSSSECDKLDRQMLYAHWMQDRANSLCVQFGYYGEEVERRIRF